MTIEMLTFVIAAFCGFKDPNITKTQKLDCSEFMINCSILQDGKTTNILVDECKTRWADIERSRK